jgi:mRNA interferase HigB
MSDIQIRIVAMRVITLKRIQDFYRKHPESQPALSAWYKIAKETQFDSPADLQRAFPQVDYVAGFYVFNIGRSYRLIVAAKFRAKLLYVRHVLTHAEYDKGKWKPK